MSEFLVVLGIIAFSLSIYSTLQIITKPGSVVYGNYIKKNSGEHSCNTPFESAYGDQWRCRRCKSVWEYHHYGWKKL